MVAFSAICQVLLLPMKSSKHREFKKVHDDYML